jgi:hypothetical protein
MNYLDGMFITLMLHSMTENKYCTVKNNLIHEKYNLIYNIKMSCQVSISLPRN